MDKVVEKLVEIIEVAVCQVNEKFRMCKPSERTHKILRLLQAHDLARAVSRKGAKPIWTATDRLISQAGPHSEMVQPKPVRLPYDVSPESIFKRHLRRCTNWVEREFKIDDNGPQPIPGQNYLRSKPGMHLASFAQLIYKIHATERDLRYVAEEK
jgi:hypothetical protein